jgi:ABC-type uncharacterized transport system substrate-binding protein
MLDARRRFGQICDMQANAFRALTVVTLFSPAGVAAHPHVFIDGGVGFRMAGGSVTHLTVTWVFDSFYSLYAIAEEGLDPDGDGRLTPAEEARFAEVHSQWMDGYAGDSYLWADGKPVALSGPQEATARMLPDGRMEMRFTRALAGPVDPRVQAVEAKTYDPTFYTYYAITEAPQVSGDSGCVASHSPPVEDADLAGLRLELLNYDAYATPEDPTVGARFADSVRLTCD